MIIIRNPLATVREWKRAPLAVFSLLLITEKPQKLEWLIRKSGFTDEATFQAVRYLEDSRYIVNTKNGWAIKDDFVFDSEIDQESKHPKPSQRNLYHDYLKSEQWAKKKKEVLDFWDYKCALCGSNARIEVHHRTYERLGRERLTDLIPLCHKCHTAHYLKVQNPR
jgi:hypothetical protein